MYTASGITSFLECFQWVCFLTIRFETAWGYIYIKNLFCLPQHRKQSSRQMCAIDDKAKRGVTLRMSFIPRHYTLDNVRRSGGKLREFSSSQVMCTVSTWSSMVKNYDTCMEHSRFRLVRNQIRSMPVAWAWGPLSKKMPCHKIPLWWSYNDVFLSSA